MENEERTIEKERERGWTARMPDCMETEASE